MAAAEGSPSSELTTSNTELSTYYKNASLYLGSSLGDTPDFSGLVDSLAYSELFRRADQDASGTASTSTATAVEEVHNNVAHLREYAMSKRSRLELYQQASAEYLQSSDYHTDRSALLNSLLNGESRIGYLA